MHCCVISGIPTTIKTMGVNITTIAYLRVLRCFNHRNWVNHYFNGGGSPGLRYVMYVSSNVTRLCDRCQCSVRQSGNCFFRGGGLVSAMCSCTTTRCIEICSTGM